ncbi:MAG: exodeoxyribonuclease VII large subunit [Clostridiales Family XIII bacterium]|jgi:exodeoxyribonuclease VII large subunit|nr:exodeoxyribonuclease VII large subunit [Clostridiales Family XIII bacterium]
MARKPIRVSQLNAYIGRILSTDGMLSDISVAGEISGLKFHDSGHVYFNLKDAAARVNCFLPQGVFRRLTFALKDGMAVVCDGYVGVYEKGGTYSLNIRQMAPEGQGTLAAAFEALKAKLAEKGYFETARKRPLPAFPRCVGIVTSNSGAAVEDMVTILTAKSRTVSVRVYPSLVQGPDAAPMIAGRIRAANAEPAAVRPDVLIVGRGGGSAEDLWAFNEEAVADAVFASEIPVISAVGHVTDFTICDFVADARAETPTAAAQMAVPSTDELLEDAESLRWALKDGLLRRLSTAELRLRAHDFAGLKARLSGRVRAEEERIGWLRGALRTAAWGRLREAGGERMESLRAQMRSGLDRRLRDGEMRTARFAERLEMCSPMAVLGRGYAVVTGEDGRAVTRAAGLKGGDAVGLRFADGAVDATIGKGATHGGQRDQI